MALCVKINSFSSPDHMSLTRQQFTVVARPCMMGSEENPLLLVKNGALEISYSPKYDHYWFSKCPDSDWFAQYYSSDWANPQTKTFVNRAKKAVKDFLRPIYRMVQWQLGKATVIDRHSKWDCENYFSLLAPYAPLGGNILEAGCGLGNHLEPFQRAGYNCFGIEPAEVWAKVARRKGVKTLVSTVQDIPEVRAMFRDADVVLSNHSMEHHWDPRILLSIARDNMKPGSVFSITVPNGGVCFALMQHLFLLHLDAYTPHSLEAMMAAHGFRCIFKSSNMQLRFVAVRDPDVSPLPPRPNMDPAQFRSRYIARFAGQLGIAASNLESGVDFSVSFKGARPFLDLDYTLYAPARPMDGGRMLAGHLSLDSAQGAAVVYAAPDDASEVLLK